VKAMELDLGPGDRAGAVARLIKLRPGLDIPLHDHGGQELTLVFIGALEDAQGRFGRGDLSYRFPGSHHRQHVDAAGDCIALQVNEGRFLPLTLKGWLIRFVARE
jgi:putative transcriptional regulator